MEDATHLAEALAARRGRHSGLLSRPRHARGCWQLRAANQVPHQDDLAAEPVLGVDADLLFDLDESGILHVHGVAATGNADCGCDRGS